MLMAENVKALRPLLPVLEAEYAKRGYRTYYTMFNSKYWGVPQNRERYFVVGVRNDLEGDFVFPTEQHDYVPKLSSVLETNVDEKYYISDDKAKVIIDQAHATINDNLSPALTAAAGMGGGQTAMVVEPAIAVVGMLDISSHDHSRRVHDPDGISPTVTAVSGGTHHIKIFDYSRFRVRKLTPTEYGRLQGFHMGRWNQVVSNSQAYKQFGNAVTTTVAKGIATSIIAFLDSALGGGVVDS